MKYFLFDPENLGPGEYFTPITGGVVKGQVYELRDEVAASLAGNPDWKESTKKAHDAQKEE